MVGLSQQRVQQITNNTDFGKICNEMQEHLKQGRDDAWRGKQWGVKVENLPQLEIGKARHKRGMAKAKLPEPKPSIDKNFRKR